jgi:hypothetical protein
VLPLLFIVSIVQASYKARVGASGVEWARHQASSIEADKLIPTWFQFVFFSTLTCLIVGVAHGLPFIIP